MALTQRIARWRAELSAASTHWRMDPLVLAAHVDVEGEGGESDLLDIPGPEGTGDDRPRKGAHFANDVRYEAMVLPDGAVGYLPADGRGWGRGLLQIDYQWHPDFCDAQLADGSFAWEHPELNLDYGAKVWAQGYAVLRDVEASICAYNAGIAAARHALTELTQPFTLARKIAALDAVTAAPHHYVTVVLARRVAFAE